jgi:hypothetical protein
MPGVQVNVYVCLTRLEFRSCLLLIERVLSFSLSITSFSYQPCLVRIRDDVTNDTFPQKKLHIRHKTRGGLINYKQDY